MKRIIFLSIICTLSLLSTCGFCDWDTVEGYIVGYSYNIADTCGTMFWIADSPNGSTSNYIYVSDNSLYQEVRNSLLAAASCDGAKIRAFGQVVTPSTYSNMEAIEASNVSVELNPTNPIVTKATPVINPNHLWNN